MRNRCIADSDALFFTEFLKFVSSEIGTVVGYDAVGDPKSADDRVDEVHSASGGCGCNQCCFDPLGELIDCNQEMSVSSW